jgi:hypothetical protein
MDPLHTECTDSVTRKPAGYAVGRERLRRTDVCPFYQQVNRDSFNGKLPDAPAEWAVLDGAVVVARRAGESDIYYDLA